MAPGTLEKEEPEPALVTPPKPRVIKSVEDLRAVLALPDPEALSTLLSVGPASASLVVHLLQLEASQAPLDNNYRKSCLRCLRVLVKKYQVLPPSLFLSNIIREGTQPLRGGGFADIFKGSIDNQPVCLKVLRMHVESDQRKREKVVAEFCNEAVLWTQLSHPNVLPFLGVNTEIFAPGFCLISPWMENGDIVLYLKENPDHDRLKSVYQIASGLAYLHSYTPMIIHGDIKGVNILVDDNLNCRLADFGLAAMTGETQLMSGTSNAIKGSLRWMAPEMYTSMGTPINSAGIDKSPRDVYAYACTVLEIMSGQVPFPDLVEPAVIFQVVSGARPRRPTEGWCPDDVWHMVERCWENDPAQRPRAVQIERYLKGLLSFRGSESRTLLTSNWTMTSGEELTNPKEREAIGDLLAREHSPYERAAPVQEGSTIANEESSSIDPVSFFRDHATELQRISFILPDPNIDIRSLSTGGTLYLVETANNALKETSEVLLRGLGYLAKLHPLHVIQRIAGLFQNHVTSPHQSKPQRWDDLAMRIHIWLAMVQVLDLRFIDGISEEAFRSIEAILLDIESDLELAARFLKKDPGCTYLGVRLPLACHQKDLEKWLRLFKWTESKSRLQEMMAFQSGDAAVTPFDVAVLFDTPARMSFAPSIVITPKLHPLLQIWTSKRLAIDFAESRFHPVEFDQYSNVFYDVLEGTLREEVIVPSLSRITVIINEIRQWPVEVYGGQSRVSLEGLLSGVYHALRANAWKQDYDGLDEQAAKETAKAFYERCRTLRSTLGDEGVKREIARGLRRIDFLRGKTKFGGAVLENDHDNVVVRLFLGDKMH